ncbi:MAG: UvrD-helicase domain-containing protein, partial [Paludibacteraceae bacterium]|nr:UvrD-helicase domain-containing protein [Paludibacteraceae bacterium]
GKGSKFNIELNTTRIIDEAVQEMIEKSNEDKRLLNWISRYVEEKIEQGKSWKVDKELKSFGQNIFNEYFQEHEQALRKQLEENPNLIDEMIKTHRAIKEEFEKKMHAFAHLFFKLLKDNNISPYSLAGGGKNIGYVASYFNKLLDNNFDDKICGQKIELSMEDATKWAAGKTDKKTQNEINNLAKTFLMPHLQATEEYRTQQLSSYNSSFLLLKNIHQLGLLWDIALTMERQNKENNRFMLSQTALFLNQMIADSDASFVYEKFGSEIKHVMIDEFQDTSRLQWRNFKSLLSEILANNNFSLLVGDVKQSIYRWRNGDWSILNSIEEKLDTATKTLDKNYRSKKQLVDFNNDFFTQAAIFLDNNLANEGIITDNALATAYNEKLVKQKPNQNQQEGFVSIDFIEANKVEAISYEDVSLQVIIERLEELYTAKIEAEKICILVRNNKEIVSIAEYLAAQKNNYPHLAKEHYLDIISNDAFQLAASPALKIIVEALRTLSDWENPVPRAQLLFIWHEAMQTNELDMHLLLQNTDNSDAMLPIGFRKSDYTQLEVMPLYELILHIYRVFSLQNLPNQSAYLYTFLDNLNTYLQQKPSDITTFLSYWDEELHKKSVPNESGLGGVRAMTIHKSKGLQFHTVIVAFCDWKMSDSRNGLVWCNKKEAPFNLELLPVNHNLKMKQSVFSEEYMQEIGQLYLDNLNLAYVAFTRAESNLLILSKNNDALSIAAPLLDFCEKQTSNFFQGNRLLLGMLDNSTKHTHKESLNILKNNASKTSVAVDFLTQEIPNKDSIFRQSNKSKDFIATGEAPTENQYIQQGNLMHRLFSNINKQTDAPKAVEQLIFDGLITRSEQQHFIDKINRAIETSQVENWFTGNYKLFNECLILTKDENGKTRLRQPDRVMVGNDEVIVVDYKFGEAKKEHSSQVQQYKELLGKMGYNNVKGYLWYVEENKIIEIKN